MSRICFPAAVAACLLAPAVARATDVRVVNERGLPQAALYTHDEGEPRFLTDIDGWIKELQPGATLRVTRSTSTQPCFRNQGGAPEGAGVTMTVPESGPATLTLPNATGPSHEPGSSDAERWIVGQINARRAQQGKPPVRVSAILTKVADAVARKQAAEQLSFPPPFCPVVVADWGFPGNAAFNVAGLDAGGTDPRKAWEHWSDGSIREQSGTLGDWNAVGVGDGGGAWAAYFANCPEGLDARCEMTADQGDASIVLPAPPGSGSGDAPGPEAPALGALTVASRQRGKAVRVKIAVGRPGSAVAIRLRSGTKLVGKAVRADVTGTVTLKVALNHSGKKLLKAKKTLSLVVEVVVDPPTGAKAQATRKVKLRA